jgi:membrane dipeptidase
MRGEMMSFSRLFLLVPALFSTFLFATAGAAEEPDLGAKAAEIMQKYMLVDTHIDVPYRLEDEWADVTKRTEDGDFDYERARSGGLDIPFMSIYTPAESEEEGTSFQLANRLIDRVEAIVGRAPEKFMLVKSSSQAEEAGKLGLIGLAMGMENGSPLGGSLQNVTFFHERGISYITLAHALNNHISDSSYDEERKWNGLSPFGKELVAEMNRVGIMIDISHVTDEAFMQVLELSRAPVIASHSSPRHFTPGWERNMSDEMIVALAENGGVIQINFGSSFLTQRAREWYEVMDEARDAYLEENGFDEDGEEAEEFQEAYREDHPFPYAALDDLIAVYQHVIELVGVDHVGIGSDFDGVGDSLPEGMKDVSFYPKLMGGNLMRVWRQVENHSKEVAAASS